MTDPNMIAHDEKIRSLESDFSNKGYSVVVRPKASDLPFDLAGFQPDLMARRGAEGVIVEVKTSTTRLPVERYKAILDRIASHEGWRFVLVTLDGPVEIDPTTTSFNLPEWQEIQQMFLTVDTLIHQGLWEPAVLYLWSVVEVALRRRAQAVSIPIEGFPGTRLLRHLYSFGEISVHEIDDLQMTLDYRNRVAHGLKTAIDAEFVKKAASTVGNLLAKWAAN